MPDAANRPSDAEPRACTPAGETVAAGLRPRVTERELEDLAEWGITSVEEAEAILERVDAIRRGEAETLTHEQIVADLGLDD